MILSILFLTRVADVLGIPVVVFSSLSIISFLLIQSAHTTNSGWNETGKSQSADGHHSHSSAKWRKKNLFAHTVFWMQMYFAGTHTTNGNIIKNHTNTDRLRSSDGLMYWTCWTPFVRVAISILLRVHSAFTIQNELFFLALCFSNTRLDWIMDTFLFLFFFLCATSV